MPTKDPINADLQAERQNISFPIEDLTEWLYGKEGVEKRRRITALIEGIPEFSDTRDTNFMSREERYENVSRKTAAMMKHVSDINGFDPEEGAIFRSLVMGAETSPFELHYVMFLPTLTSQCSDTQQEKWLPLAVNNAINGTYAQTELGHGTDLRKLETTSTYDPTTEEFVLNTPTLTSTKWWPGNLGKSANYAIVQAQLWSKGKCHGLHAFLVQLRHLDTHMPLKGIVVGDIGPKLGFHSNDNGFLRLDNVRIPRDQMLMRYAKIEKDGTYVPPVHEKLGYGTMLFVRSIMIRDLGLGLAKACTIAIRYSCVRRQGEIVPGAGEVKLLDYATQQYKLLPYLASAYAYYLAGYYISKVFFSVTADIRGGNVDTLPELHALASGLKAFITWESVRGMEVCRLACGGHGYSMSSGLPELYSGYTPSCTYEGDNTVLFLQVARYLVKQYRNPSASTVTDSSNGSSSNATGYLHKQFPARSALTQECQLEHLQQLYQRTAQRLVQECVALLDQTQMRGYKPEEAWNMCSIQLTRASKAYVHAFIVQNMINNVRRAASSVKTVATQLVSLYVLWGIERSPGKYIEDGFLSQQQLGYVRHTMYALLGTLRRDAVSLVDAWELTDRQLRSVLGRYDGNVYENLLKWAQSSPLNEKEVLDCHHKYLGPMMKTARSKL